MIERKLKQESENGKLKRGKQKRNCNNKYMV